MDLLLLPHRQWNKSRAMSTLKRAFYAFKQWAIKCCLCAEIVIGPSFVINGLGMGDKLVPCFTRSSGLRFWNVHAEIQLE